jgi:hypothetical protein
LESGGFEIIAIVGDSGASDALCDLVARLPASFAVPILYRQNLSEGYRGQLPALLEQWSALPVRWARDVEVPACGVLVCPPGRTFVVRAPGQVSTSPQSGAPMFGDALFESLEAQYGPRAVAITMSDGSGKLSVQRSRAGTLRVGCSNGLAGALAPALVSLVRGGAAAKPEEMTLPSDAGPELSPLLKRGLWQLLDEALSVNGADLGTLQLFDRETGVLRIAAQRGFGVEFLDHFREVRRGDGSVCSRTMGKHASASVADVLEDADFAPHRAVAEANGVRSVQSVAIVDRKLGLCGVISTHWREPRSFEGETQPLEAVALRASQTLLRLGAT